MTFLSTNLLDNWQRLKLEELCEKITDGTHQSPPFTSEGVPFLFVRNIVSEQINFNVEKYVTQETYEELTRRHRALPGDILFSAVGSFGVAVVVNTDQPFTFQRHIALIKLKKSKVDPYFLAFYLNSPYGRLQSEMAATGGSQRTVTLQALADFIIPLPPLAEQKRIAAVLGKCDRLRRTRRYALQLSDTFLQSFFLQMFGDPVTNPMGWDIAEIANVCVKITDGTHQPPRFTTTGVPFIFVQNIVKGEIDFSNTKYVSESTYEELTRNTKIEIGDILYSSVGSFGVAVQVLTKQKFIFQRHIAHLKPDQNKINPTFLCLQMNSDFVYSQAKIAARGVAQPTVNLSEIRELKIIAPPFPLQEKFAQIVKKFERFRTQQREAERQAEHLFQTLLHRAFQGKLTSFDFDDEVVSALSKEISVKQAKPKSTGDIAEYLHTKISQQETEAVQLTLPGLE